MMKHESESSRSKSIYEPPPSSQASPMPVRGTAGRPVMLPDLGDQSPRQRDLVLVDLRLRLSISLTVGLVTIS
ncbi:unnamed protein product [Heligmosomoides polygyrus]|uniref:Uncharacterized protein n=1 Tax=Heligmosomoides polygyrus TaxID=6339 RepID=A0A3P7UFE6_HELPZ|nr:unnamed protein product [Heligmosomoides polygyrus]